MIEMTIIDKTKDKIGVEITSTTVIRDATKPDESRRLIHSCVKCWYLEHATQTLLVKITFKQHKSNELEYL